MIEWKNHFKYIQKVVVAVKLIKLKNLEEKYKTIDKNGLIEFLANNDIVHTCKDDLKFFE